MGSEDAPPVAPGTGATTGFTWLVSATCLGIALVVSGQILIFKSEGSPATLELLGVVVYATPFVGLFGFLSGALVLFWAAWNRAPGPWDKLRGVTWALAIPAAAVAAGLLFGVATQTEFPGGVQGDGFPIQAAFGWVPLVIVVVAGFTLSIDSITRLPGRASAVRSLWIAGGAIVATSLAIVTPLAL
jgi:hypothetical protein